MTPSKSMPQKSSHDFKNLKGTLVSICSADILPKNSWFFSWGRVLENKKDKNDIEYSEEGKMIVVDDKWLHSLSFEFREGNLFH